MLPCALRRQIVPAQQRTVISTMACRLDEKKMGSNSRQPLLHMAPTARPTLLPLCPADYEEDSEGSDINTDSEEEDSEDGMRMLAGKSRECHHDLVISQMQERASCGHLCVSERTGSCRRCYTCH